MAEVISRYRAGDSKTLPTLYRIPSMYGAMVLVNPNEYKTDTLPKLGGAHRMNNPNNPNTYPFKALSMEETGIMRPFKDIPIRRTPKEISALSGSLVARIRQDRGRPSWKRGSVENWWIRHRHVAKPHLVGIGIGIAIMSVALLVAECAPANASAAPVTSNSAALRSDVSNWPSGSAQGDLAPAPMPNWFQTPTGKLQICKVLESWNWGNSNGSIRTLELHLNEQRCAPKNIPVGYVSESYLPGE